MHLGSIVYVAFATLLGAAVATPAATHSKLTTFNPANLVQSPTESRNDAPTLRTDDTADETEGERGFNVEKIKSAILPKVTKAKLADWVKDGKPVKDVFTRLELAQSGSQLLDNPQFFLWVKYVDDVNAQHPDKATSVFPILSAHYGDERLMNMFAKAMRDSQTKDLAIRLKADQVQYWAAIGKAPDDVFTLFKLDTVKKSLFNDPQFNAWTRYVDEFNAKNPDKATTTIPTLTSYYGDDALFKMIESAKTMEETKTIATKLETDQLQGWLSAGRTPDNVFVQMGLSQAYYILEWPQLNLWAKYLQDFNAKYPDKKTSMIETFTRRFGDEDVAQKLIMAKKVETTKLMATNLERAQVQNWLSKGKSTDDVFTLLKLGKVEDKFFDSPLLSTWTAYLDAFNKANPDKKSSLFAALLNHYRDAALFKILDDAKRVPGMENIATKWQTDKIQGWLADKKSPDDVLILVGLEKPREDLLSTSLFNVWLNYVKVYNKANPSQKVNVYSRLHAHYQDYLVEKMIAKAMKIPSAMQIAKTVQADRLKRMLNNRRYPTNLFTFLRLDTLDRADNLLANPDFKSWTKYLGNFNQRYPQHKTTMIDALMKANSDYALSRMLLVARKDPITEKQATRLFSLLMNKWVSAKKDPSKVSEVFKIINLGDDALLETYTRKFYKAWGRTK